MIKKNIKIILLMIVLNVSVFQITANATKVETNPTISSNPSKTTKNNIANKEDKNSSLESESSYNSNDEKNNISPSNSEISEKEKISCKKNEESLYEKNNKNDSIPSDISKDNINNKVETNPTISSNPSKTTKSNIANKENKNSSLESENSYNSNDEKNNISPSNSEISEKEKISCKKNEESLYEKNNKNDSIPSDISKDNINNKNEEVEISDIEKNKNDSFSDSKSLIEVATTLEELVQEKKIRSQYYNLVKSCSKNLIKIQNDIEFIHQLLNGNYEIIKFDKYKEIFRFLESNKSQITEINKCIKNCQNFIYKNADYLTKKNPIMLKNIKDMEENVIKSGEFYKKELEGNKENLKAILEIIKQNVFSQEAPECFEKDYYDMLKSYKEKKSNKSCMPQITTIYPLMVYMVYYQFFLDEWLMVERIKKDLPIYKKIINKNKEGQKLTSKERYLLSFYKENTDLIKEKLKNISLEIKKIKEINTEIKKEFPQLSNKSLTNEISSDEFAEIFNFINIYNFTDMILYDINNKNLIKDINDLFKEFECILSF